MPRIILWRMEVDLFLSCDDIDIALGVIGNLLGFDMLGER